jgi:hypothetical protein
MNLRSFFSTRRAASGAPALAALFLLVIASRVTAQTATVAVVNPTEQLSFDRPEAWALKYFTSASLLAGLDTSRTPEPGSIAVGFEVSWLPTLSDAQRRVGFDGTKVEDLNKAPFFPRPRVTIGLPDRFALIVAGDPPIRSFGIKTKLLAFALERPVYETPAWSVGLRGFGQIGNVEAAFTCPASVLAFAPDSPSNAYGCQAESSDAASLRFAGGQIGVAYRGDRLHKVSPHAAIAVNYLSLAFQVNALRDGFLDRTYQTSHGVTLAASGGIGYPLTGRLRAAVDLFYTPLSVSRVAGAPTQNDGLFNIRALIAYQLR